MKGPGFVAELVGSANDWESERRRRLPVAVLISGYPGSGKTSMARHLAMGLGLPLAYRDGYKELLFDALGTRDREWSRQLGAASYRLLWSFAEEQFRVGRSCLLESNFSSGHDTPRFLKLRESHGVSFVSLTLHAPIEILSERFLSRWSSGSRHQGHCDNVEGPGLADMLRAQGPCLPLALPGWQISVDTSDFRRLDSAALLEFLRTLVVR
jgi:predicted kinase